ncbi:tRNA epoxyqueuosine(34) reductase QueG [bacterium]|nr:tRNA epoxyqueuosine(34) reductase QueG [bacterium]
MTPKRQRQISSDLRRWAKEVGFDLVGIAPATKDLGTDRLTAWLEAGMHGEMKYLEESLPVRRDPSLILDGVKSVVVVGLSYRTKEPELSPEGSARISRYAWGTDYHDVIRAKLRRMGENLKSNYPDVNSRRAVDSAPIMERDYAVLAGLGWIGKNTLLLDQRVGSWLFLGVLLVDAELDYDEPTETDHCGSCQQCIDACPTQALEGPYQLDARRCISYLTIEHRSAIEEPLARKMGPWVYGCDICQEVCPWNEVSPRRSRVAEPLFLPWPGSDPVPLEELLRLTPESFSVRWEGSSMVRADRDRLVRNAIIAAVHAGGMGCRPIVADLASDSSEVVRHTARWALALWGGTKEEGLGSEGVHS